MFENLGSFVESVAAVDTPEATMGLDSVAFDSRYNTVGPVLVCRLEQNWSYMLLLTGRHYYGLPGIDRHKSFQANLPQTQPNR